MVIETRNPKNKESKISRGTEISIKIMNSREMLCQQSDLFFDFFFFWIDLGLFQEIHKAKQCARLPVAVKLANQCSQFSPPLPLSKKIFPTTLVHLLKLAFGLRLLGFHSKNRYINNFIFLLQATYLILCDYRFS